MAVRSLCLCRYEKQLQEEELSLQQQRRRLYKEVAEEKEMLAQLVARWVRSSSALLHDCFQYKYVGKNTKQNVAPVCGLQRSSVVVIMRLPAVRRRLVGQSVF